ncbi:GNAT family N-acetyltransferase [Kribbella sandramycini]|uniref:GNAT family N-acetyltransferase n=1 Tax=Kribbella sandramycini TaxID=60450 RepID=A0A7Y4P1W9_9ACTN|nr:GNAT family N-acetyltransferase [Kribbella sandramycini]MBB6564830.1 GNAT superfamily N-acetyltransferase [Kribbella sandramycini]NOL42529.1 GNAT family N-acetyltransferase [Kribbella sandramycini]
MDVRVTSDPAAFAETVFPLLQQDPVLHTVIMTNVHERATGVRPEDDEPAYYVSVHDGDVVGAAMRTPGRGVYLGALQEDLAELVADTFAEVLTEVPGVAGSHPSATRFAARWQQLRGGGADQHMATRLHKLIDLTPLAADAGAPRPMQASEIELVAAWGRDGFPELGDDPRDWAEHKFTEGTMWIWAVDGVAVSMVGFHRPVFGVCRVGPVYTPPEHRRHGYAGALTSHVTAQILADGNQACLYTDLANPTSNKIYHQAGYRPVGDFTVLEFTE